MESPPYGARHFCRGPNRGEMLTHQARFFAPGADALDTNRTPGNDRQRERGTQNLPAPFALGTVNR